ncbi:MAG: electron transfer flavoprotein subunit beta/FixA family protein [Dehalococcoidia bacterium]
MPLNIVACLKQVPHPDHFSRIGLDPRTKTIQREGIPVITNPVDNNALEAGLRLKEKFSGKVTVVSMGPPKARETLEEALAVGADEGVLLCDPALAGADTLATAYPLACGIRKLAPFDLVLCGCESVDGNTGQLGPQLAEFLGIPHVTRVTKMDFADEGVLLVHHALERGYLEVQVKLPALLTVTRALNRPRLPTVIGIMEAMQKEIRTWGLSDLDATPEMVGLPGSPTQVVDIFPHHSQRRREILEGDPDQVVREALRRLRQMEALR